MLTVGKNYLYRQLLTRFAAGHIHQITWMVYNKVSKCTENTYIQNNLLYFLKLFTYLRTLKQ